MGKARWIKNTRENGDFEVCKVYVRAMSGFGGGKKMDQKHDGKW